MTQNSPIHIDLKIGRNIEIQNVEIQNWTEPMYIIYQGMVPTRNPLDRTSDTWF